MKSFLAFVAQDILQKYGNDLSDIAIVFPNKRASLFLNEQLARLVDHPLWSPTYITISDLFRQHTPLKVADPIKLVCDLHKSFVNCTGIDETLDHFYGWGQLLITDFDDVDKNMASAQHLFANLRDIHELDDVSYLTEEQKEIIKKFFSHFSEDHNTELKKRFLQLWSHFLDIYNDFNERLAEQNLAYEGALYRRVVEDDSIVFKHKKYLFVGFNMMQQVEQKLCMRLQKEGKATFYWDYDQYYMSNGNEAGYYIRQLIKIFGNELAEISDNELYNAFSSSKDITYINAPTDHIQARYVHTWLMENERFKQGRKTAIVLADESLLPTVIHSLPEEVKRVNITLGYPLQQTPFYSLVQKLIDLQTLGYNQERESYRLRYVNHVLRHPYAIYITPQHAQLYNDLHEQKVYLPSRQWLLSLSEDEGTKLLFGGVEDSENFNLSLVQYLLDILKVIGTQAREVEDPLFQESLFRTYTLLNRLHQLIDAGDLIIDIITLQRLVLQLMQTTSIPFHGEPAEGIQIMGVLETRNLDFDHIIVLSASEGNLPKGVSDSSFIPYALRKAYGLTSVDNKVAIYSYYFHSMLQRANDITLTYNNSTEDGHTGEMSRFMLQLLVEGSHAVKRRALASGQVPLPPDQKNIEKTEAMIHQLIDGKTLSPTFINTYLRCQKRFYYRYILGLKEPEELEDEIDNRLFGLIFHRAAELFYLQFARPEDIKEDEKGNIHLVRPLMIGKQEITYALEHDEVLYRMVDEAFAEELFRLKKGSKLPHFNGLQLINREVIISYLKQLLRIDERLAPYTILGLETEVKQSFEFDTPIGKKTIALGGYIDRLDAVAANGNPGVGNIAERIRVIDYKTGRKPQRFPTDVEAIFDPSKISQHTDYYLQAILYSFIVSQDKRFNKGSNPVSPGLLFIQQAGSKDYDPTLLFGKEPILDVTKHQELFMTYLEQLIGEICNPENPLVATSDKQRCEFCPFTALCK